MAVNCDMGSGTQTFKSKLSRPSSFLPACMPNKAASHSFTFKISYFSAKINFMRSGSKYLDSCLRQHHTPVPVGKHCLLLSLLAAVRLEDFHILGLHFPVWFVAICFSDLQRKDGTSPVTFMDPVLLFMQFSGTTWGTAAY